MEVRTTQRYQPPVQRLLGRIGIGRQLLIATLPLLLGMVVVISVLVFLLANTGQNQAQEDLEHNAEDLALEIEAPLSAVSDDVTFFTRFLQTENRFESYISAVESGVAQTLGQEQGLLQPLGSSLETFLTTHPRYTYVAVLNADGQELIRAERSAQTERVSLLPTALLSDQANTIYVQEARQIRENQLWVSPVELRRAQDTVISEPLQATLRVVASVFDEGGRRRAFAVFQINVSQPLDVINNYESAQGFAYVVDADGYYLAHDSSDNESWLFGRDRETGRQLSGELADLVLTSSRQRNFEFTQDNTNFLMSTYLVEPFGDVANLVNPPTWKVVVAEQDQFIRSEFVGSIVLPLGIALIALILTLGLIRFQSRAISYSIEMVRAAMNRLTIGDLAVRLPDLGQSEVGELADAFNRSTDYLQSLVNDLETSVQDRIRDLEITAEISREVAGLREVSLVLNRAINLIVQRFDFYHAQVFLLDDLRQDAMLVASTGDAGQRLLDKQHKLAVGSQSVIGRVTSLGVTVIAGDTGSSDVPWQPNVELPDTHAEMALPLKVENLVIGALDVQSKRPDAFGPTDIEVFQVLADQLAIAINNARLLTESEGRLQEVEQLNLRLTQQSWQEFGSRRPQDVNVAYRYDLLDVQPEFENTATDQDGIPLSIRGMQVGAIETAKPDLTDEERALLQAVAERVSLAIDNARLFQETQLTLSESQRLYETARTISASADLNLHAIYTLIVDQLIYQETLDSVAILLAEPIPSPRAALLAVNHIWLRDNTQINIPWDLGDQTYLLQQGLGAYYQDQPRQILGTSLAHTLEDGNPGKTVLSQMQDQCDAATMMLIPLTTGVKWFGLLVCASEARQAFDNAFVNFATAVADQLAISIENRRLLEQVQDEARRSLALAEAGQLVSQIGGEFEEGITRLFQAISGPADFNRWWFGLVADREIRLVSSQGGDSGAAPAEVVNLNDTSNALTAAIALKQVILVNDLQEEHPLLGHISAEDIERFGKHLAVPVQVGDEILGVALIGRDPNRPNLDEGDVQLATTLASQLAVTTQNRRLFENVQRQQETLQTTVDTMPAGVMLLDQHGQPILTNQRAVEMLGDGIQDGFFAPKTFSLYQVDTGRKLSPQSLAINSVLAGNESGVTQNISVAQPTGNHIDVLLNAQAIRNERGLVTSVVAVLQEITELRNLERQLQASLSETTTLYETSRSLLGAGNLNELTRALVGQMGKLDAQVLYLLVERSDEFTVMPPGVVISVPRLDQDDPTVRDIPLPEALVTPDQPLIIEDTHNITDAHVNPELGLVAAQADIRAMVSVPLSARGRVLGWLVIGYQRPQHFSAESRRFINSVVDQTSVALDGIRLFENTERALRSVANLYQSSRRVAEAQGIQDAIEIALDELRNFEPDRIDLLLQTSVQDVTSMSFAIRWAAENSLEMVPSLPVHPETADSLGDFDVFAREEYYIEDFLNESDSNPLHEALYHLDTPYQAILSAPLRVGGRTIGRFGMGFLEPRFFTADDRQLLNTLADATAYVVENDLLLTQTQESLEETGVLYQASRTIANAETREEIIEVLIDYAASPEVDRTILITLMSPSWDAPGAVIEVTQTWGDEGVQSMRGLYFTRDQFPLWDQISVDNILWYDDIQAAKDLELNARMGFQALGMLGVAILPLQTPSSVLGCVIFGTPHARHHGHREIRVYQALADQASVQLENRRLYEQTRARARQLVTAAEVSRAVTSILDQDVLFSRVVDLIIDAFDYDHVQIFMVDDNRERAYVRASTGEAGRQLMAIQHSLAVGSDSVIGRVSASGEPIIALDTSDPEVIHRPNPYLPETRSEMALPLIVQGRVVGALDVQSKRPQAFDEDDIQALTPLVDQLAVAIENARLFEFSERRAEEMRFLFFAISAAEVEAELGVSLQNVLELLLTQIEADTASIFLYDQYMQSLEANATVQRDPETENIFAVTHEQPIIIELGEGFVGTVAEDRLALVIDDVRADDRHLAADSSSRSGIYVPLLSGNDLLGVLTVESDRIEFFDDNALQLLQALGTSISAVINNKQLLDEVQRTNERLMEVDQLKTNFLAAMSHELRTPLNSIIGFSRVILKGIDGPLTEMQEQDIQTIHDSGKHLLGLVNDILDQAKIEAGKMELDYNYFDLKQVVDSVMASAIGLTRDKPIRLFTEVDENIPQAYGDEFRTRQILFNLISNAAKFTNEGSITVGASSTHDRDGNEYIEVRVIDTGIGIAEENFDRLFESFQQVDNSTTRAAEGTGLGLPLSRSLARLQGGELWVASEVGTGSTFFVSIPIEPTSSEDEITSTGQFKAVVAETSTEPNGSNGHQTQAEAETEEVPVESSVQTPEDVPEGRTILAVDDDEEVIALYQRYLRREGWYVVGTTDPEDVEDKIRQYRPEIVLLDINMPNRSGWQVLEDLKSNDATRDTPVIVCSIDDNTTRSESMGAAKHLMKPFIEGDLIKAVRTVEKKPEL